MLDLNEKTLVLGVSGSIAAYKAVLLARLCTEAGADVWPVMTPAATRFVGPLTFSALTGHRAIVDLWGPASEGEIGHVEMAHRADLLVLAPATADLLARLANGRAEDPLSAIALATQAPWIVAPAMETGMWEDPATQSSVQTLAARGAHFVAPDAGKLASGRQGRGRMAEPERVLERILATLTEQDLQGKRLLITAGPTRESFDPVRFFSNRSTGKMGYALARMALRRGAAVHLITGPTLLEPPHGVKLTRIETTDELATACEQAIGAADAVLMAAAPADYAPAVFSTGKIKKSQGALAVEFKSTPDVLATLRPHAEDKVMVGFAAESGQLLRHARDKLQRKGLDLIVANDITLPNAGFGVDTNVVTLLGRDGSEQALPMMSKEAVADAILDEVAALLAGRPRSAPPTGRAKAGTGPDAKPGARGRGGNRDA